MNQKFLFVCILLLATMSFNVCAANKANGVFFKNDQVNVLKNTVSSFFLIKQFACMNFHDECPYTIFIINTMPSDEDEDDYIINNLKIIYFANAISYQKVYLERKKLFI